VKLDTLSLLHWWHSLAKAIILTKMILVSKGMSIIKKSLSPA
jgi:hypothetical protein